MSTTTEHVKVVTNSTSLTYTVDSFANGIAFGQHKLEPGSEARDYYQLRLLDEAEVVKLRSRYALHRSNPIHELEGHLMRLSRQGLLSSATIYLGVSSDPFVPFEGKFDVSMKFLQLFQRYTPGMLIVQTRSPLIVIAMPVLKRLGDRAAVTIGLESDQDDIIRRYTPGMPLSSERLRAATTLRRFNIETTLQVNPLLPYGDWKGDAKRFASTLIEHADYVDVRPMTDGTEASERKLRSTPLARKLADDRKFHWLRPDSANPVISALEAMAPEKLKAPIRKHLAEKQVKMFAA